AREAALLDERDRVLRRGAVGQHRDLDERHHHLADGRVTEVEDVVDQLGLLRRHLGLAGLHLEQRLQLLARDEGARVRLAYAVQTERQADHEVGKGDEGHEHDRRPDEGTVEPEAVRRDERHLGRREEHRRHEAQGREPEHGHAATSCDAGFLSETSTSTMRVRSTFSTVTLSSEVSARSARRGTRPKRSSTHPPTVSYDSLEMRSPVAALRSSIGSLPATRKVVASTRWMSRSGSSN